ncbi:MAG: transcriptional regulator [Sideroxyarcus sp.]|nr:transcriptional regulator [Sideroxyarcus sp.]
MEDSLEKLPSGIVVKTTGDVGGIIKAYRKAQNVTQIDMAEMIASGNRFVIEAEGGKPTIQTQKLMDLLAALGLEMVIRKKS